MNFQAVYPLTPNIGRCTFGAAANVKSDGTGTIATDIFLAFTAGANGAYVERIRLIPVATTAATATSATVHRIYLSTKTSGATTNADTTLFQEIGAAAQTADATTTAIFAFEVPLNIKLPAGHTILVSTHIINAANTNWEALTMGMDL